MEQNKKERRCTFGLQSLVLLCLLYLIVPMAIKIATGTPANSIGIGFDAIRGVVGLGFWMFICWTYRRVTQKTLERHVKNHVSRATLLLLPCVLIGIGAIYLTLPKVRANRILITGDLAPLPESSTGIKIYTWYTPFSGQEFLRFDAAPEDIEDFLQNSPIIQSAEVQEYSKNRMRLDHSRCRDSGPDHEYFNLYATTPPWYRAEITTRATRYYLPIPSHNTSGEVIVYKEQKLVFVKFNLD